MGGRLDPNEIISLERFATPTVANGWEQITDRDPARECFNLDETRDFMPQLGPMVGRAVTLVVEPGNPDHRQALSAWLEWRHYATSVPGPKIVVVQDLDKPATLGSFWGEVNASVHQALGCRGTIVDGAIRDVDEMTRLGFKALARRLCVGHAHVWPVRWDCQVEVFGCPVEPGQVIHADEHGFLAIPGEDEDGLLDAVSFMDDAEVATVISAARRPYPDTEALMVGLLEAEVEFAQQVHERFGGRGEFGASDDE